MATEKMYELALRFYNAKLWDLMYDDELFAVGLSDGEIGYCSIMGEYDWCIHFRNAESGYLVAQCHRRHGEARPLA